MSDADIPFEGSRPQPQQPGIANSELVTHRHEQAEPRGSESSLVEDILFGGKGASTLGLHGIGSAKIREWSTAYTNDRTPKGFESKEQFEAELKKLYYGTMNKKK